MKGIDVSHYQGNIDWGKVKSDKQKFEFAFMKCTESVDFLDDKFARNKSEARKAGILCGYYHFARGGDYKKEADWFLKNVGEIKEGELIALDYEIATLSDPADWCRKWLDYVASKVGFKPMLYTYHATLQKYDWKKVSDGDYGLWAARYGLQETEPNDKYQPATGSWKFFAIWQFCSQGKVSGITGNVDLDYCSMDLETLKKYGKAEAGTPVENKIAILNQNDYAGKKFGSKNMSDMAKFGCKLFSFHYCYRVLTGKDISIEDFDAMLVKGGCYFGDNGDMLDDATVAKTLGWEFLGKETDVKKIPEWYPTIKEVDFSIADGKQQHFVAMTAGAIEDPYGGVERAVNYYEEKVGEPNWEKGKFSYRLFKANNSITQSDMENPYDKNLYRIFNAVGKFLGKDYGENPSDKETDEIEKKLKDLKDNPPVKEVEKIVEKPVEVEKIVYKDSPETLQKIENQREQINDLLNKQSTFYQMWLKLKQAVIDFWNYKE
jgi:GH25 family lysozyme M1 (1,4-beta-N-acetylmuramidase)